MSTPGGPPAGDAPDRGSGAVVRGLSVVVGRRGSARRAVDGLHLQLGVGVHGLLGPNGAGKTTLMRVLATVVPPTEGDVVLLGHDVRVASQRRALRRRLGYLPQSFGYYPRFTVREFVEYFAWLKEVPSARAPLAVDRAIERVGLSDRAGSRMKSLSGGMLRRAGLAQALVNDPDLLLLDEPTAGLDPEQRLDLRALLREAGVHATVLVCTHLVEDVASACTRVAVVDAGRLVATGTPAALADVGRQEEDGDHEGASPIERGYTALLRAHRVAGPGAPVLALGGGAR
ncbi:ABC transporter ATP-binding protein [Quadrisphaera sp. DSM 44207]|uniref:ABC transporter ATP-binding protein n=1 Tax=Quadrisphaera sp. DSM 44207 TaxID=1881057 RepID=UPI000B868A01